MYAAANLVVHVTDLHVLRDVCAPPTGSVASQIDELLSTAAGKAKSLAVSLRLALPVFEALDTEPVSPSEETRDLASIWSSVWPNVARMSNLQHLRVEIDHTDLSSWSVVNERKVLGPVASALEPRMPDVAVTIILPKLHPRHETEDRHFVDDDMFPFPLSITRRVRQKCQAWRDYQGTWLITRARYDTFPMIPMLEEEFEVAFEFPMLPNDYEHLKHGELERWKRGEDPLPWMRATLEDWWVEEIYHIAYPEYP